ncbi:MAG: hypothetical protein K1X88_04780 [Nannocystaceae bacterium]|nr:hypothetical protein [Nannocystaceae bacterium]
MARAADRPARPAALPRAVTLAYFVLCIAVYAQTAPGRILFPDDEIVFQTTRALWQRGALDIEGIPKRTGELEGRPDGTFGWAPGRDGKRYGFFGHALSIVALPSYGAGVWLAAHAPETWRHAIRSDHYFLHRRSPEADWTRLAVSTTNLWITPLCGWLLARWLLALGFALRPAMAVALVHAFGTLAWPYSRTLLSEPLSAVTLVGCAWCIAEFHRATASGASGRGWALGAGTFAAITVHVHVLNLVALPCLLGYAVLPLGSRVREPAVRAGLLAALLPAIAGLALLLWGQWWRYGDAFETGRYDHYSHWVAPGEGLLATLFGPGRSLLLFTPPLLLALPRVRVMLRRVPAAMWCALAIALTRWLLVGLRSDWWGGWSIGPRYLVPTIPLLLLPLATWFEPGGAGSRRARVVLVVTLASSLLLALHLSLHSIFEWMLQLTTTGTPQMNYLRRSHWLPQAHPVVGFLSLPVDTLGAGALRLARHGHSGPLLLLAAIAAAGAVAAWRLAVALRRAPSTAAGGFGMLAPPP